MKYQSEIQAISYDASAHCNMNCTYCFNPKVQGITGKINDELRRKVLDRQYIEELKQLFPNRDELHHFGHWGGEPGLNLPQYKESLYELLSEFPKLDSIMFSTNMSTKGILNNIENFADALYEAASKLDRKVTLSVQGSMDGPPELSSLSRLGVDPDKLLENFIELFTMLFKKRYDPEFRKHVEVQPDAKPTFDEDGLHWLANKENLRRYFKFYDELVDKVSQGVGRAVPAAFQTPTWATPGQWTVSDGLAMGKLSRLLFADEYEGFRRAMNLKHVGPMQFYEQFFGNFRKGLDVAIRQKRRYYFGEFLRAANCSAGIASLGLDANDNIHICQQTFFYNEDTIDYIKEQGLDTRFTDTIGWSMDSYEKFVKDKYVVNRHDKADVSRFNFVNSLVQLDATIRNSYYNTFVNEAYIAEQIDVDFFHDVRMRTLFAYYLANQCNYCYSDNIFTTGSGPIDTFSRLRLLGNGAFEAMMKRYFSNYTPQEIKSFFGRSVLDQNTEKW